MKSQYSCTEWRIKSGDAYLARHLEVEVLLDQPVVVLRLALQPAVLVVLLDKVLDDGAGLPEGEVAVVGVDDGGDPAIGVDLDEPLLLGVGERLVVVGNAELLEDEPDLVGIGAAIDSQYTTSSSCEGISEEDLPSMAVEGDGLEIRHDEY